MGIFDYILFGLGIMLLAALIFYSRKRKPLSDADAKRAFQESAIRRNMR